MGSFDWGLLEGSLPRPNPGGLAYRMCPVCSDSRKRHKRARTLAVKFDERGRPAFAKCQHCGAYTRPPHEDRQERRMYDKLRIRPFRMEKKYVKPVERPFTGQYSEPFRKYLEGRGISALTAIGAKVAEGMAYMPQVGAMRNTVQFRYYMDSEMVNVKYRDGAKNFKMEKDAMLCLYNLDSVRGKEAVIITEGEFDALSFLEAGLGDDYGVVSVPNGATVTQDERKEYEATGTFPEGSSLNLGYLDSSYGHLKDVKSIYIATDSDIPGARLAMELQRRFFDKSVYRVSFEGYKDANELLVARGPEALRDAIDTAKRVRMDDVYSSMDVFEEMEHVFRHGTDQGLPMTEGTLGEHLKLVRGYLYVINGVPGHGKSSFIYYMMVYAMVRYGWKFGIVTPEIGRAKFFVTLIEILVGKPARRGDPDCMSADEFRRGAEYINEKVMLVSSSELLSPDQVEERFRHLVAAYGIDACVIDPWNSLHHDKHDRDDEYLTERLSKLRLMCLHLGVSFFVSAHPITMRETEKGSDRPKVPSAYHLAGGAMWFNRADVILTVYRSGGGDAPTEIHVQKVKQHDVGGKPTVGDRPVILRYSLRTKRYHDDMGVDRMPDFAQYEQQQIDFNPVDIPVDVNTLPF